MIGMRPTAHQGLRLLAIGLLCLQSAKTWGVPSFARQTGMTCAACHTVFPELTPRRLLHFFVAFAAGRNTDRSLIIHYCVGRLR
jgi:hypothetical protein